MGSCWSDSCSSSRTAEESRKKMKMSVQNPELIVEIQQENFYNPVLLAWTAEDVARLVLVVVADVLAVVVETPIVQASIQT